MPTPEIPRSWKDQLARTWLANPDIVSEYDRWVRAQFRAHRGISEGAEEALSPWSVQILVVAIERFTEKDPQWLWAIAAMANLSELLFCAEDGGIKPSQSVNGQQDLSWTVARLRTIRNVCFHPAFQKSPGQDRPHMLDLIDELKNDDQADARVLADDLEKDWANFGTRPAANFALRTLNSAGALYARSLRERNLAFLTKQSAEALNRILRAWKSSR